MTNIKVIGYVVGVFDLFHYGHENILLESIKRCDKIIIGIHTDTFTESYKRKPIDNENIRKNKVINFLYSLSKVNGIDYEICIIDDNHIKLIDKYNINIIFHGTDWELESYKKQIKYYEHKMDEKNIKIELIDYTKGICTTDIINQKNYNFIIRKKCFLFDLDNTLMLNNQPMKFASDLLQTISRNNKDIYLITNNNRYSPNEIYEDLKKNNLHISYENIISSLVLVKDYLIKNNFKNIYLWGTLSAKKYLEKNNINVYTSSGSASSGNGKVDYDIVVILYNNNFNYKELVELCSIIKNKNYIIGNIDPCYPDKDYILPDTGSILKLVEYSCDKKPLEIFGKPNSSMISLIKQKYSNDEIIFIGDSEITDKKLALNSKIDFLRVHKHGDISDLGVLLYYLGGQPPSFALVTPMGAPPLPPD